MARKSFRTSTAATSVEFDIDDEVFRANSQISAGVLMKFADLVIDDEDDESRGQLALHAIREFFTAALVKEDRRRFFDLLEDPDRTVDVNLLVDIANWLGEQYTARPTGTPSSSTSSETASGVDSTDGALPVGTTFSRKETPVAG